MAQELLTTFPAEIGEVALLPGTGGVFEIRVNDELIWSRKDPHPATYELSEPWTHPPILWAATDEAVGSAHGGHGGHGASEFTVGGGASGTW